MEESKRNNVTEQYTYYVHLDLSVQPKVLGDYHYYGCRGHYVGWEDPRPMTKVPQFHIINKEKPQPYPYYDAYKYQTTPTQNGLKAVLEFSGI